MRKPRRAARLPSGDSPAATAEESLATLLAEIRACRVCRDAPRAGKPLPHEPRPVLIAARSARIAICGQAPGTRVHASGVPFTDPSGNRLRTWMGLAEAEFYDSSRIAILPMGFCFPGQDAKGGDLPPRRECAELWRKELMTRLDRLALVLLVGIYAQRWHLGQPEPGGLTGTVKAWKSRDRVLAGPRLIALPHPSWRNNAWIRANPWFDLELVPWLRAEVRSVLDTDRSLHVRQAGS